MPRLRNIRTGSVVNVDDATAAQLGDDYEPIDDATAAQLGDDYEPIDDATAAQLGDDYEPIDGASATPKRPARAAKKAAPPADEK